MTNVARHADCSRHASLRITLSADTIATRGRGRRPGIRRLERRGGIGHGLASMRARAVSLGAEFRRGVAPLGRRGTRIAASPSPGGAAPHGDAVAAGAIRGEDGRVKPMSERERIRVALCRGQAIDARGAGRPPRCRIPTRLASVSMRPSSRPSRASARLPATFSSSTSICPACRASRASASSQRDSPEMRVLMLTVYEDEEKVFDSICNGASGYLAEEDAARAARRGRAPGAARGALPSRRRSRARIVRRFRNASRAPRGPSLFSRPRKSGCSGSWPTGTAISPRAISSEVTINTVRDHVRAIYEKLHVHSRSEAVSKALRRRFID